MSLLLLGVVGRTQAPAGSASQQQALSLESQGHVAEAHALWVTLAKADANDAVAEAHLGLTAALLGRYEEAVPAYRSALALHSQIPGLELDLGLALFKQGRLAEAVAPLQQACAEAPTDTRTQLLLGLALFGTGQYAAARAPLRAGLQQSPGNLQLHLTLAQSCLWSKDYDCALEQYQLVLKQDPSSAQADMIAGEALDAKGDTPGAIVQFRAAVAAAPRTPEAHFGLGYLLWKQGAFAEAEPQFRQELELNADDAQALAYLGDVEMKANQNEAALLSLERCLAQPTPVRLAIFDLAVLEEQQGHKEAAEADLRRAIALEPANPDAHWRLARLLQSTGRRPEAAQEFAAVQKLHKDKDQSLAEQIAPHGPAGPKSAP